MKNINKISYEACTGCNACKQICPKQCISHKKNDGFLYPIADENVCIDCGKCLKVCPAFESLPMRKPLQCFAGYNTNDEVSIYKVDYTPVYLHDFGKSEYVERYKLFDTKYEIAKYESEHDENSKNQVNNSEETVDDVIDKETYKKIKEASEKIKEIIQGE